jgi:hypothetical protein
MNENFTQSGTTEESSPTDSEVTLVQDVRAELEDIDASELSEHSARFEALHEKLQQALKSIDGL